MIEINNLTTNPIDEEFLKKVAEIVLGGEDRKSAVHAREADLSIALVGPGRIRELNKKYRRKNKTTDVLAFPESKVLLEKFKIGTPQKIRGLGEIIICLREVKKNAKRFGASFEKELARVLIHGILHLLDFNHDKSKEAAKIMEAKQEHYLSRLCRGCSMKSASQFS